MPIKLHTDGTVTADTAAELAEYTRALRGDRGSQDVVVAERPRRRTRASKKTGKKKSAKKSKNKTVKYGTRRWTPAVFRQFCESIDKDVRETIAAGLKAGVGADSAAIAKITGSPLQGIGKRVMKIVNDAEKFSKTLPAPMRFVGAGGKRTLQINSAFANAAGGAQT